MSFQITSASGQNRIGFAVSTMGRVQFTEKMLPGLDCGGFDLIWCDGSVTPEGKAFASARHFTRTPLKEICLHVSGGPDAAIQFSLKRLLELGYDYVGLIENDIELKPGWLPAMMAAWEAAEKDGFKVGAATARSACSRVYAHTPENVVQWNVGAAMILFSRAAAGAVLADYGTNTASSIHHFYQGALGLDLSDVWELFMDKPDRDLGADWRYAASALKHGMISVGTIPHLAENIDVNFEEVCGTQYVRSADDLMPGHCLSIEQLKVKLKEAAANRAPISVATESEFARKLRQIIAERRPQKLIETGTHLGQGTTTIIASALKENGLDNAQFHSIEVNPQYYLRACRNLRENGLARFVTLNNGVSVPRRLLPTAEEIAAGIAHAKTQPDVYLDHAEERRVDLYLTETQFDAVEDDLLGKCLAGFGYEPHFLLLDSAGHMGWVEFQYVLQHIKGPCVIAFDDVRHIKHYQSLAHLRRDPRFRVIAEGAEKFGYCIADFTPAARAEISTGETEAAWMNQYLDRALAPQAVTGAVSGDLLEAYANWKNSFPAGTPPSDPRPIEAMLQCHPQYGGFCADLGIFLRADGHSHQARRMFERAVRFAPRDLRGWQELARYYYCDVGNTALAVAVCGCAMRCAQFDGPVKSLIDEQSGFYSWEGEFCWLDREASLLVHTGRLVFPAELEFTLTGADAWCYGKRPVAVTVSSSETFLKKLIFSGDQHCEKVAVPLPVDAEAGRINIESSIAFVPSQISPGSRDTRRLSVRMGRPALRHQNSPAHLDENSLKRFLNLSIR